MFVGARENWPRSMDGSSQRRIIGNRLKRELHGGHDFENGSNEHDMQLLVSEHDFISADPGTAYPETLDR
jgi:hypothetical protein